MKSLKTILSVSMIAVMFLASCTVEKRTYMSGYHIDWKNNKNAHPTASADVRSNEKVATITNKKEVASIASEVNAVEAPVAVNIPAASAPVTASTEKTISVATATGVKAENSKISVSDLKKFVKENKKEIRKSVKENKGGGKSQIIALILCAVVGTIGIHRFYLGYIWQGVVQLLTLGGCGIWTLIDLIRIITGDLQPKDGSYDKTL